MQPNNEPGHPVSCRPKHTFSDSTAMAVNIDDACLQHYHPRSMKRLRTADNLLSISFYHFISTHLHDLKTTKDKCSKKPAKKHFQSDWRTRGVWLVTRWSPPLWQRLRPQCPAGHMEQSSDVNACGIVFFSLSKFKISPFESFFLNMLNDSMTVPAASSERFTQSFLQYLNAFCFCLLGLTLRSYNLS